MLILKKDLNKKQIMIVTAVSLLLVLSAVGADLILKSAPSEEAEIRTATVSTASKAEKTETPAYQYAQISSKLTDIVEDKPYEPSPDVLNLAYFYPEGAETDDVINSYAGRLYTELTTKEAQYMADIYDMSDRTPLNMAKQLGLPTSRVLGKYNPNDPSQNADNPATWTVNSFKNANVAFYDGDGNRINAYSAVKEIMAMASVYSYYHGIHDYETMRDYALKLWERSHSYTISMGNVYYDSGCLNKTVQQEAEEAIEQEKQQQLLEESLAQRTAASSGGNTVNYETTAGPANDIPETSVNDEATLFYNPEAESGSGEGSSQSASQQNTAASSEAAATLFSADASSEAAGSQEETTVTAAPAETQPPVQSEASSSGSNPGNTASSQGGNEATFAAFSKTAGIQGLSYHGVQLADNQEATFFAGSDETQSSAQSEANSQTTAVQQTPAAQQEVQQQPQTGSSQPQAAPEGASTDTSLPGTENSSAAAAAGAVSGNESTAPSASSQAQEATMADTGNHKTTVTKSYCPGHVDLYITVTIYGIDDSNGLMKLDTIGNSEANFNDEWKGWTEETKAFARSLNAEDWFKRYGLTISAINVRNPLTESEIDAYLSRIPDTVSQQRKDVVSFALHSVGKVPYYWGGKPSAPRYEQNGYGTLVPPDTKGRVLRGLDCSGWVNWVYWSALGTRLAGESTGTLIGCGERIARSELQPGDIIVRTGADAHVVMFLEWAGNGNMIAVHETGGATNNVTVSEISANWPYYRKLIQ